MGKGPAPFPIYVDVVTNSVIYSNSSARRTSYGSFCHKNCPRETKIGPREDTSSTFFARTLTKAAFLSAPVAVRRPVSLSSRPCPFNRRDLRRARTHGELDFFIYSARPACTGVNDVANILASSGRARPRWGSGGGGRGLAGVGSQAQAALKSFEHSVRILSLYLVLSLPRPPAPSSGRGPTEVIRPGRPARLPDKCITCTRSWVQCHPPPVSPCARPRRFCPARPLARSFFFVTHISRRAPGPPLVARMSAPPSCRRRFVVRP